MEKDVEPVRTRKGGQRGRVAAGDERGGEVCSGCRRRRSSGGLPGQRRCGRGWGGDAGSGEVSGEGGGGLGEEPC
ncbi:hypothetical protein GUJ93_ZPchr0009g2191 [Zizania palustris]|uniref:Uncharacterized protein n=1 Tax=Zizania palustris TaxID=103762 RepID=A0A8J5VKX2_ZIZPA|nr:hypothetical protein GUJ93_ZPchr0009g2191 [Zizania palustris]